MPASARRHETATADVQSRAGERPGSLRARALQLLKRRDYSRAELERKLAPYVEDTEALSALLAELAELGWLSEQRLAEALVRKHAARFGTRRVFEHLQERGIDPDLCERLRGELKASELERARAVWWKRFGRMPADLREQGRQARFLEQRGFEPDVIRRVLRGRDER